MLLTILLALTGSLVLVMPGILLYILHKEAGGSVRNAWHSVCAYVVLRRAMSGLKLRWEYTYRSGSITFVKRPVWRPLRYKYARIVGAPAGKWQVGDLFTTQLFYIGLWPIVYRVDCRTCVGLDTADFVATDSLGSSWDAKNTVTVSPLEVRLLASEFRTAKLAGRLNWKR